MPIRVMSVNKQEGNQGVEFVMDVQAVDNAGSPLPGLNLSTSIRLSVAEAESIIDPATRAEKKAIAKSLIIQKAPQFSDDNLSRVSSEMDRAQVVSDFFEGVGLPVDL